MPLWMGLHMLKATVTTIYVFLASFHHQSAHAGVDRSSAGAGGKVGRANTGAKSGSAGAGGKVGRANAGAKSGSAGAGGKGGRAHAGVKSGSTGAGSKGGRGVPGVKKTIHKMAARLAEIKSRHAEKETPPEELQVFTKKEIKQVVSRIEDNLIDIMHACPDYGLNLHICQEIRRITDFIVDRQTTSYNCTLRAHEYTSLCLCMPYVFEGLLESEMQEITQCFVNQNNQHAKTMRQIRDKNNPIPKITEAWYMYNDMVCTMRQTTMSNSEITTWADQTVRFQQTVRDAFAKKTLSDANAWNIIKFHWLPSFPVSKMLMGSMSGISTQPVEHSHQTYVKPVAKETNSKGNVCLQMMAKQVEENILCHMASTEECNEDDDNDTKYTHTTHQIYGFPARDSYLDHTAVTHVPCSLVKGNIPLTEFLSQDCVWRKDQPAFDHFLQYIASYLWLRYREDLAMSDEEKKAS